MGYWQVIDTDQLVADSENPRFDPVTTEDQALLSILDDQQTSARNKLLVLARSIAADGLNPSEELVVSPIGDSSSFLVREGNRRVAAIKLSLHPERIPEAFVGLRDEFAALGGAMQTRRHVRCYVSNDEEEIRRVMQLRHVGEIGGAGLVRWNTEQQTRFSQGGNAQARRAVTLVDDLTLRLGDCEITRTAAAIPSTNLGRLISTPEVRKGIGVEVDGDEAHYVGGHDGVLLDVLRTVEALGLASINRKEDRVALVRASASRLEPQTAVEHPTLDQLCLLDGLDEDAMGVPIAAVPTIPVGSGESSSFEAETGNGAVSTKVVADEESAGTISAIKQSASNVGGKGTRNRRRKPVSDHSKDPLFGRVLRPKGQRSNDVYRAVCWIDQQYLTNPVAMTFLLPILGFSMRLLLETSAREYFAAQTPPVDNGDNSLKVFLKEAKPLLKAKLDSGSLNSFSLAAEWINGSNNFEGMLAKWAHGTMNTDRGALVQQSMLVAEIIEALWT